MHQKPGSFESVGSSSVSWDDRYENCDDRSESWITVILIAVIGR
jgi:hypothetical protein